MFQATASYYEPDIVSSLFPTVIVEGFDLPTVHFASLRFLVASAYE